MEGNIRSGGVLKVKNSSGCLIVKKKDDRQVMGRLAGQNDYSEGRKRPGLMENDWGSGEEYTEPITNRVYDKKFLSNSMCHDVIESREMVSGRNGNGFEWNERKKSRYEPFDHGVCDGVDAGNSRKKVKCRMSGNSKEFGYGDGKLMAEKWKHDPYLVGSGSVSRKRIDCQDKDETHMSNSLLRSKNREDVGKPIRFQGKNGVLKVMVNKKTKLDLRSLLENYSLKEIDGRNGHGPEDFVENDASEQLPYFSTSEAAENQRLFGEKVKNFEKKSEGKPEKVKPIMNKDIGAKDLVVDGTDTVLKLAPPGLQTSVSNNTMRKDEERSPSHEHVVPIKDSEGKAKRGGSTEKQILREKIRHMLVDAGWTIDYRGRHNRDYLDAVYINPNGTAYWSIIKAYEAFQKKMEEEGGKRRSDPSFAPISEDLIKKLTRKTKKKIEMERKKIEEDGMIKKAGKSATKEDSKILNSDPREKKVSSLKKQKKKTASSVVDHERKENLNDDNPEWKARNVLQAEPSKIVRRLALHVRSYGEREDSNCKESVPCYGKTSILAWLIDSGTVQLSEKVQYFNSKKSQVMLEGWITRDGIHCGCCSKILTPSKFELHAGGKLRQPFENIFLESGVSLLQCQIDAWNHQKQSLLHNSHNAVDNDDPYDDACGICGDGGDLVRCDSCPSTFHQICLEIQKLPSGVWHCSSCTCKFCGHATKKDSEENANADDELLKCSFCEKKYHKSCSPKLATQSFSADAATFCGLKCQQLYEHLEKIVGIKHELGAGFSWSLIRHLEMSEDLLSGFPLRVECNSKLAVALSIMDECFFPVIGRSGTNIIRDIVYNKRSNLNRVNYNGFYTAILEQGEEIVSAASIRFHGSNLAEMPLIGTRRIYRRRGMVRCLLSAIEKELSSLRVKKLVIPAATEYMQTWITSFGFHQLDDAHSKKVKSMNTMVFPAADLLQKELPKHGISEGSTKIQVQLPKQADVDSSMETPCRKYW